MGGRAAGSSRHPLCPRPRYRPGNRHQGRGGGSPRVSTHTYIKRARHIREKRRAVSPDEGGKALMGPAAQIPMRAPKAPDPHAGPPSETRYRAKGWGLRKRFRRPGYWAVSPASEKPLGEVRPDLIPPRKRRSALPGLRASMAGTRGRDAMPVITEMICQSCGTREELVTQPHGPSATRCPCGGIRQVVRIVRRSRDGGSASSEALERNVQERAGDETLTP